MGNRKMGDFWTANPPIDVVITTFDLVDNHTRFIKPWKDEYKDWPVVRAVLASSSVPTYFPVVDQAGRMIGILSINDIREVMFDESLSRLVVATDVATLNVVRVFTDDSLQTALDKMVLLNVDSLPVVKAEAPEKIVSMISKRGIIGYYHSQGKS